jgi:hypothetical protein
MRFNASRKRAALDHGGSYDGASVRGVGGAMAPTAQHAMVAAAKTARGNVARSTTRAGTGYTEGWSHARRRT